MGKLQRDLRLVFAGLAVGFLLGAWIMHPNTDKPRPRSQRQEVLPGEDPFVTSMTQDIGKASQ